MNSIDRSTFDERVDTLLHRAENLMPSEVLPDLPGTEITRDAPRWYSFEYDIWQIGEQIRQLTAEHKKKFHIGQINRILAVCMDKRAKRGRQSFIMLLAKKSYNEYAGHLIPLLDDDDVDGHVIYTLYRMQAGEYVEAVKPFLSHKRTWIRNEAKKYIQKYQSSTAR